ncbi:MAG: RibD family protein [Tunicatimonas sp.]
MNDNVKTNASVSFLHRTLDLAAASQGTVFRGPWLGWVVADGEEIIAEGSTKAALFDLPAKCFRNGTLFLSINPFATAQELATWCASLALNKYYVATAPESPVQRAALDLNRRFLTWRQQKRPYLILKWAETADGFIAPAHSNPYWISNAHARRLVHQWRSQEAAIWVGKTTAHRDNPRLDVRYWTGPNPLRIVIDPQLQLSPQLHIFDQSQPTLCYNAQKTETRRNLEFAQIPGSSLSWKERIRFVLDDLYARQIQSVLVEGGATLLSFLINEGWWDEARVFQAPVNFEEGLSAPRLGDQHRISQQRVSDNTLTVYRKD